MRETGKSGALAKVSAGGMMIEAGAVFLLRISFYAGPLLVIPYLARKLNPEGLGLYATAQSTAALISMLVEFGFAFTATARAARHQQARGRLGALVAQVLGAQLVLGTGTGVLLALTAALLPAELREARTLSSIWAIGFTEALSMSWFWLGVGKLARIAWLEPVLRLFPLWAAAVAVQSPKDMWLLFAIPAAGRLGMVVLSRILALRYAAWVWPNWRRALRGLRLGFGAVPFRAVETILSSTNCLLMGVFCPATQVGIFAAAEKLVRPLAALTLDPLHRAVYPRVAAALSRTREQALIERRRGLQLLCMSAAATAAAIGAAAPLAVVLMMGDGFGAAATPVRILALGLLTRAVRFGLGLNWMIPAGMLRQYNHLHGAALVIYLLLAVLVVPVHGAVGMAVVVVAVDFLLAAWIACLTLRPNRRDLKTDMECVTS